MIRAGIAILSLAMVLPVEAGEWTIQPRFNLSESYTDNVQLSQQDKFGDLITTVLPGVSVRGDSVRLDMNLDYNLQYLKYLDNTQFDDHNHQLQADTELMVLEDLLYFQAGSRISQQNTNNNNQFANSNRSQTGNRTNVIFYQFGPVLRHAFGSYASLDASYQLNTSDRAATTGNNPNQAQGTDEEVLEIALNSGPRFGRLSNKLAYRSREQERASRQGNSKLRRLSSELGYQLNRFLKLTAEGGAEFNEFQTARNNQDGPFWFVGGTWTPGPRTNITGRFGHRFFGNTFNVQAEHRMRRLIANFSYGEDARTTNQIQSAVTLVPLNDAFGNPVLDSNLSSNIDSPFDVPTLGDDVILDTRMNASLSYAGRRRSAELRYFENDNTFQRSGVVELNRGVSYSFTHRFNTIASAMLSGSWRKTSSTRINGRNTRIIQVSPSVRFALGRHINLNFRYEFLDGTGNGRNGEFTENAVTADLGYSF